MGLFGEIDGKSIFFAGDTITQRSFIDRDTNLNGFNFCRLGKEVGFMKCADILLKCKPEYIAISHYGIIKVNENLLKKFKEFVSEYEPVIKDIVAQDNPNMGLDPNWIYFKPIRITAKPGENLKTDLIIRNYLNKQSKLEFNVNLPNNWAASPSNDTIIVEPNTFKEIPILISIPKNANSNERTIITADIKWNEKDLGPFPDLMVDHGFIPSETWKAWRPENDGNLFLWIFNRIITAKGWFR